MGVPCSWAVLLLLVGAIACTSETTSRTMAAVPEEELGSKRDQGADADNGVSIDRIVSVSRPDAPEETWMAAGAGTLTCVSYLIARDEWRAAEEDLRGAEADQDSIRALGAAAVESTRWGKLRGFEGFVAGWISARSYSTGETPLGERTLDQFYDELDTYCRSYAVQENFALAVERILAEPPP